MQWASQFVVGRSDMFTQYFKTTFTVVLDLIATDAQCSFALTIHRLVWGKWKKIDATVLAHLGFSPFYPFP